LIKLDTKKRIFKLKYKATKIFSKFDEPSLKLNETNCFDENFHLVSFIMFDCVSKVDFLKLPKYIQCYTYFVPTLFNRSANVQTVYKLNF
jgi:hypothetical protein